MRVPGLDLGATGMSLYSHSKGRFRSNPRGNITSTHLLANANGSFTPKGIIK